MTVNETAFNGVGEEPARLSFNEIRALALIAEYHGEDAWHFEVKTALSDKLVRVLIRTDEAVAYWVTPNGDVRTLCGEKPPWLTDNGHERGNGWKH